jgi:hypothetical protein
LPLLKRVQGHAGSRLGVEAENKLEDPVRQWRERRAQRSAPHQAHPPPGPRENRRRPPGVRAPRTPVAHTVWREIPPCGDWACHPFVSVCVCLLEAWRSGRGSLLGGTGFGVVVRRILAALGGAALDGGGFGGGRTFFGVRKNGKIGKLVNIVGVKPRFYYYPPPCIPQHPELDAVRDGVTPAAAHTAVLDGPIIKNPLHL